MSNLFNRRVTVMASIFWETKCLNTAWKRISSAIIFHVLLRLYEYTKTKGLDRYDSGKTTSLPKSHTWNWWITRITSIIAENKSHVHHESHLHTMKVVKILIPSFTVSARNAWDPNRPFVTLIRRRKTGCRLWISVLGNLSGVTN